MRRRMMKEEINEIVSNFNPTYFDTLSSVKMNIFAKRKDGRKIGVRWCMHAWHNDDHYQFTWGDKIRHGKAGYCFINTAYRRILLERTPEQIHEWCENICGGEKNFRKMLKQINDKEWEKMGTVEL